MTLNELIQLIKENNISFDTQLVFRDDYEHYEYLIESFRKAKIKVSKIGIGEREIKKYGSLEKAKTAEIDAIELSD